MVLPQNSVRWRVGQKWFHCDLETGEAIAAWRFWGGVLKSRVIESYFTVCLAIAYLNIDQHIDSHYRFDDMHRAHKYWLKYGNRR